MSQSAIRYLKDVGFDYKSAESPQLWTHLENQVTESQPIGAKFSPLSASAFATMVATGESALLEAMEAQHRKTGKLEKVHPVIELPFVVGTVGIVPLEGTKGERLLQLVDHPGTPREQVIHVLFVDGDVIPCTRQVTVTGGTYGDGHTIGLYGLCPGDGVKERRFGGKVAYLATAHDLKHLAYAMEEQAEDIVTVTRRECETMLAKIKEILG